jgi:hypothetical protein
MLGNSSILSKWVFLLLALGYWQPCSNFHLSRCLRELCTEHNCMKTRFNMCYFPHIQLSQSIVYRTKIEHVWTYCSLWHVAAREKYSCNFDIVTEWHTVVLLRCNLVIFFSECIIYLCVYIGDFHLYSPVLTCIRRGRKPNGLFEAPVTGLEPRTFRSGVGRVNHCATGSLGETEKYREICSTR